MAAVSAMPNMLGYENNLNEHGPSWFEAKIISLLTEQSKVVKYKKELPQKNVRRHLRLPTKDS